MNEINIKEKLIYFPLIRFIPLLREWVFDYEVVTKDVRAGGFKKLKERAAAIYKEDKIEKFRLMYDQYDLINIRHDWIVNTNKGAGFFTIRKYSKETYSMEDPGTPGDKGDHPPETLSATDKLWEIEDTQLSYEQHKSRSVFDKLPWLASLVLILIVLGSAIVLVGVTLPMLKDYIVALGTTLQETGVTCICPTGSEAPPLI